MSSRAVIYSRFSTDLQNEKSIEDQEAVARAYAAREGFTVVGVYSDAAMSGGSIFGRDGLIKLMADARDGRFDTVIVEELDRLSRDMEDLAGIHKRLSHLGIKIRAIHEGIANTVTVGLRGLVGQLYREDLAHKTRRGLRGKVMSGLLASGVPYGYRMDPINKGVAIIDEAEADQVRRIFRDYLAGNTPRDIAISLNREGIPGPRGNVWQHSSIIGWEKRGTGILRNRMYAGTIVWNRTHFTKDPDTGRRVSRLNPDSELVTIEAPELRIVDQHLFDQVQAVLKQKSMPTTTDRARMRRPQRLLSGLIRCAACGGGMSSSGKDKSGKTRIACTRHRDSGTCPAPMTCYMETVEDVVIDTLRAELQSPERLVKYVKAYNEARQEFARETTRRRSTLERRIRDMDAEVNRALQLLIKGIGSAERLEGEVKAKEAELADLRAELNAEPAPVDIAVLHPHVIKRYEAQLGELKASLESATQKAAPEIGAALRELVDSVTVSADPDKWGGVRVVIQGKLRKFLEGSAADQKSGGKVVAGAGFEPTTFRL